MSALPALGKMAAAGVLKGATGEVGKLLVHGAASNIPWQHILPTKNVLLTTVSVELVPAPIVGKKKIHVGLDIDVDEMSEAVTYQGEAFHLAVPPLNQAVGCLALSMAMAAIWIQLSKKWNTVKPKEEKATGIERKTDSGATTSPNAGSGEID